MMLRFLAFFAAVLCNIPGFAHNSENNSSPLRTRELYTRGSRNSNGAVQQKGRQLSDSLQNATKQSRFLLEEPTVPYVSDKTCSSVVGASALERHTAAMHGDVCRFAEKSLGFFCPEKCFQVVSSPYCVIKVMGSPAVPCRVAANSPDGITPSTAATITQPSLEKKAAMTPIAPPAAPVVMTAGAPMCQASDDPARKNGGDLVRHTLEPSHGDVCLVPGDADFFCPSGCSHLKYSPWCGTRSSSRSDNTQLLGSTVEPCRVPLPPKPTMVEQLSERLRELAVNMERHRKNNDEYMRERTEKQIKLVKSELKRAKAELKRPPNGQ